MFWGVDQQVRSVFHRILNSSYFFKKPAVAVAVAVAVVVLVVVRVVAVVVVVVVVVATAVVVFSCFGCGPINSMVAVGIADVLAVM